MPDTPRPRNASLPPADPLATIAFAARMLSFLNGGAAMLMTSIGHRTGLFDAMADGAALTPAALAARAHLHERYVREWLGAMTTSGIVVHDATNGTYTLPAAHAACLTRAALPTNIAATAQWIGVLGSVEDRIVDCFRNGGGVGYDAFTRFHEVMAEESAQTTVAGLEPHILPLVDGLVAELERGIDVLDVGCGRGRALSWLAQRFPRSRFTGYDLGVDAIADARTRATRAGLANVTFTARDVADLDDRARFDLVCAFDAIHDQARPADVLAGIARALRPGGTFLMQEIRASSHVHENVESPLSPFVYTISCMHCMTVSLAQGGAGLGAAWGHQLAERMLRDAGFAHITRHALPHDILNDYWIARADAG